MKKIILPIAMAIAIACLSCSDNEAPAPEKAPEVGYSLGSNPTRSELTSLPSLQQYRRELRNVNPARKVALWRDKMQHTKQFFAAEPAKVAYLETMRASLNASMFAQPSTQMEEFNRYSAAIAVFDDPDVVHKIFMVLHDYDKPLPPFRENGGGSDDPECTCYYSIYCGVVDICDEKLPCQEIEGCGVWGNTNCQGLCGFDDATK